MPFTRDTRCPFINIEFNTNWIVESVEEREYKRIGSDKDLNIYVEELETAFMFAYINNTKLCVNDWLCDNYNNVKHWNYTFEEVRSCHLCGIEDENDEFVMNEYDELCCDGCLEYEKDEDLSHIQPKYRNLQKVVG